MREANVPEFFTYLEQVRDVFKVFLNVKFKKIIIMYCFKLNFQYAILILQQ